MSKNKTLKPKQEMISAPIVEVVTRVCLALLQDIAPPANTNIYREVNFCESIQPTKSESE